MIQAYADTVYLQNTFGKSINAETMNFKSFVVAHKTRSILLKQRTTTQIRIH